MDVSQRSVEKDVETTKSRRTKSPIRETKEKPALSPIEEETDTPDSSADSVVEKIRDITRDQVKTTKNSTYDGRVGLRNDYAEALEDLEEGVRREESPPFLTARNATDHEGRDSSATTSYERNSEEDNDEDEEEEEREEDEEEEEEGEEEAEGDSSLAGESTSGDVDYYDDDDDNDLEAEEDDDLGIIDGNAEEKNMLVSSRKMRQSGQRPKSAPSCTYFDTSDTASRDERLSEISTTLDWLKARIVKSERDIFDLKKNLRLEKTRGRKFARCYEEDRKVMRESLRIDLELWIKKLNDGLKEYLSEWQKRERLRLNEEISRISDLYSQEIAKSLKISLKEWQIEEAKSIFEVMERREKSRDDNERIDAKAIYEKIHTHLENLEKRNKKSYGNLCKQIDKWEERLRDEIVKIHEEDLKKLRQQVSMWYEDGTKKNDERRLNRQRSREHCTEMKRSSSFVGAEALLQVEENLLKRLRDSSTKDLRRTEQIVRTELKTQRRELAKRMNDKIGELWMAFEEFGCNSSFADRLGRTRCRNDQDDCRVVSVTGNPSKDGTTKAEVPIGRWRAIGKIVGSARGGRSSVSNTDVEDGDRDLAEDEDDYETIGESSEQNELMTEKSMNFPSHFTNEPGSTSKMVPSVNNSQNGGDK